MQLTVRLPSQRPTAGAGPAGLDGIALEAPHITRLTGEGGAFPTRALLQAIRVVWGQRDSAAIQHIWQGYVA